MELVAEIMKVVVAKEEGSRLIQWYGDVADDEHGA